MTTLMTTLIPYKEFLGSALGDTGSWHCCICLVLTFRLGLWATVKRTGPEVKQIAYSSTFLYFEVGGRRWVQHYNTYPNLIKE